MIIQQLGGEIGVELRENRGSKFNFTIQLDQEEHYMEVRNEVNEGP